MLVRCPSCQSTYRLDPERVPQHAVRVRCPRCTAVFRVAPPEPAPPAPPAPAENNELGIEREAWQQPPRSRVTDPRRPAHAPQAPMPAPQVPASAPPKRPTWTSESERTLDFGAAAPKPPAPRLETAPFRPGAPGSEAGASAAPQPPAPAPAWHPELAASNPPQPPQPPQPPPAPRQAASGSVSAPSGAAAPAPRTAPPAFAPAPSVAVARPAPEPGAPAHTRARRLARVLVSDVLVYNQAARDRALQEGSLASVLAPEISKAWDLYKSKVGPEVATSTPYFKDALNEILAGGAAVF